MLQMDHRECALNEFKGRVEYHGDEHERAIDLGFSFTVSNAVLEEIAPGLRESFYMTEKQGQLPGTEFQNKLRFPNIKSLAWDEKIKHVVFTVHGRAHDDGDIVLGNSSLTKLGALLLEGGSVTVKFSAQVYATPEQAAVLYDALGEKVHVSWRKMTDDEIGKEEQKQQSLLPDGGDGDDDDAAEAAADAKDAKDRQQLKDVSDTMRLQKVAEANKDNPDNEPPHKASRIARGIARNEAAKVITAAKKTSAASKGKGAQNGAA